ETYFKLAGLAYETRAADPSKAPKGKIPYVDIDGVMMGDSQLIIEHVESKQKEPLDAWLDARQRAAGHAVRRMIDEGTYFGLMGLRWSDDEGFAVFGQELKKVLPGAVKLALPLLRRGVKKAVVQQGTGRHSPEQIHAIVEEDFDAVADILGDSPFL